MSSQFLLECRCGEKLRVRARQAGESLTCQCGHTLEVPTLRELQQLPLAHDDAGPVAGSHWTAAHGLMFAFGVPIAIIALGLLVHFARQRSELDLKKPAIEELGYKHDLMSMTLEQTWDVWTRVRSLELERLATPRYLENRERAALLTKYMVVAGAFATAGLVSVVAALIGGRRR